MIAFAQKTVHVAEAGTLVTLVSDEEKYNIEDLTVTGEINGTDLRLIRDMAGNNYKGELTEGKLSRLDLSGATIVEGGENYLDCYTIYLDASATMVDERGFIFGTQNGIIPQWLFVGCNNLREVRLPENTTAIEEYAFAECMLTSITVPSGITSIGERAFYHNLYLKAFKMPSELTSIGSNAFAYCSELTEIDIPAKVNEMEKNVFRSCSALKSVRSYMTVPCSITEKTFSVYDKATFYIPYGTKAAYEATSYWNKFQKIVEMELSDIKTIKAEEPSNVYDLSGRPVPDYAPSVKSASPIVIAKGHKFIK